MSNKPSTCKVQIQLVTVSHSQAITRMISHMAQIWPQLATACAAAAAEDNAARNVVHASSQPLLLSSCCPKRHSD